MRRFLAPPAKPFFGALGAPAQYSPCQMGDASGGWLLDDGITCSKSPGDPCDNGFGVGMIGINSYEVPGSGPTYACVSAAPSPGEPCMLGNDPATGKPTAGVQHASGACVDTNLSAGAFFDDCVAQKISPDTCLILGSTAKWPTASTGQPLGASVNDASHCASGYAMDLTIQGQQLHVCTAKPTTKPGDPCEAGPGLPGKPGLTGTLSPTLVCIADAGQGCQDAQGVPGVTKSDGSCGHTSAGPGAPCQLPNSTDMGVLSPDDGTCVKPGDPCKGGVIDPKGACVASGLVEGAACQDAQMLPGVVVKGVCVAKAGQPCDAGTGPASGITSGWGVCVAPKTPAQSKEGDPCLTAAHQAGKYDKAGACVQDAVTPGGGSNPAPAAPEEPSKLPWILLALVVAGGAYHLSTMKKSK
jgi:hypothetical protein